MRVTVETKCPYCGYVSKFDDPIEYTPFASMANKSAFVAFDSGKAYDIATTGGMECENCSERFLFKFEAKPVCLTAKMPEYKEAA